MNPIWTFHSDHKYCSQQASALPPFYTIEEGIKLIKNFLEKKILCRHDVVYLAQAYQTIDELEKNIDAIHEKSSHTALLEIVQKMETMRHEALAEQIITAYHLEQFKVFPLNQTFSSHFTPLTLDLEKIKEIATHLPFCESEQIFNIDVETLLGTNHSDEIAAILQVKKDQFTRYVGVEQRWPILQQLREKKSSLYPFYLEEVLNRGLFHLYDHLIAMKAFSNKAERESAIKELSFSSFVNIIFEFRGAVLSQAEKMIPPQSTNIVFLLGNTKSGKSTTFCYLRKELMVMEGTNYRSSTGQDNIIGEESDTSYTLFPNISVDTHLTLVDFPGFTDTHGEVISLAIELTLRALARKYSPKILLLTSITDTESGYDHAHSLGIRVKRVLGTLDNCILGLTKYSKDPDFIKIQAIEKVQREKFSYPTEEESKLQTEVDLLLPMVKKYSCLQGELGEKEKELARLQEIRLSSFTGFLPNTKEKTNHLNNIFETESNFKKYTGIDSLISFADLTDQNQLKETLKTIEIQKNMPLIQRNNNLDINHKALIEFLFENNLKKVIASQENHSTFPLNASLTSNSKDSLSKNIEAFEQSILETSLINTILAKSHPEIGKFLHLEEMDIMVVREYDKKVITDCIHGYIDEVISGLLITEDLIKELKKRYSKEQSQKIEYEWSLLKEYILTLAKGTHQNASQDKVKEAWESLQKEHQERLQGKEKELNLPGWLKKILLAPLGIPYGIFAIFKQIRLSNISKKFIEEIDQTLHQNIKAAAQAVIALKDIENTVRKKDRFDEVFSSYPLLLDSISSLQESLENQMTKVKMIYGEKEWEARVTFLTDQLKADFSSIRPGYPLGETILYALISQEIPWEKLPPYFDQSLSLILIYSLIKSQKNYQEIRNRLVSNWKASSYQDLKLSNPSYFFHTVSVTKQEHASLREQGEKFFEQSYKTPIDRLLLADAIYKLSKSLSLISPNQEGKTFNSSTQKDEMKILRAIEDNEWILEYSQDWLRGNQSFILAAVRSNIRAFTFATDSLKKDKKLVLTAVQQNSEVFRYASETLKNDGKFVLDAIRGNSKAFQYASETLKNDGKFVLDAIRENGEAFRYASETLKNDRKFVLNAIREKNEAFRYASETLKNDRKFVLNAIRENGKLFEYISETLKNDRQFVLDAIRENGKVFEYTSETLKNDRKFILNAVRNNSELLEYVNEILKNDEKFILEAVHENWRIFKYINEKLKNNKEILLAAVKNNGEALKYASEVLKNDPQIILASIKSNSDALEYASLSLKNDPRIILAALKQHSSAFEYASETLKNNKEVVLAAVKKNGLALEYASEILKNHKEIVLAAVKKNGMAIQYASEILQNDRGFILPIMRQNAWLIQYLNEKLKNDKDFLFAAVQQNGLILKYIDKALKRDRELVLAAVKENGMALEYASEILQNDREVVLTAVKENGMALEYASEILQNDREVVLTAVKESGMALQYASEILQNDRDFLFAPLQRNGLIIKHIDKALKSDREVVLAAVKGNWEAFQYASEILQNDREVVLTAVKGNWQALRYASEILQNDRETVLTAVKGSWQALQYASEILQNDKEVVLTAMKESWKALQYASEILQNDKEVVLIAVKEEWQALQYASKTLKNDRDLILTAVQKNWQSFKYASERLKNDRETVLAAVKENGWVFEYISEVLKDDKEVAIASVKENGLVLQYASEALKNNREVVLAAVQKDGGALKYAHEMLKNDKDIVIAAVHEDGWALEYANQMLKNDKEVVLIAVQQNGLALEYASKTLKNDREIVLIAVKQNKQALKHVGKLLLLTSALC